MAKPEAPEFALLKPSTKSLIRKLGNTPEHEISVQTGEPGKGWLDAENMGWIFIRSRDILDGYRIQFTLNGWERWCRQVDVDEGTDPEKLAPLEFE